MIFTGTAIYVYFILANAVVVNGTGAANSSVAEIYTECSFFLDGAPAGGFVSTPDAQSLGLEYNALAFSVQGLDNTDHTLRIETAVGSTDRLVWMGFDYAVYTCVKSILLWVLN